MGGTKALEFNGTCASKVNDHTSEIVVEAEISKFFFCIVKLGGYVLLRFRVVLKFDLFGIANERQRCLDSSVKRTYPR